MSNIKGLTEARYLGKLCPREHEFKSTKKSLRYKSNWECVVCVQERSNSNAKAKNYRYQKKWAERNKDKIKAYVTTRKDSNYYREYASKATIETKIKYWYKSVKNRAYRKGIEFNLTPEWLLKNLPSTCPVLNIPLSIGIGKGIGVQPGSASIDRFDNSKGYTEDNCRIISRRANVLKSDSSIEELKKVLYYMEGKV